MWKRIQHVAGSCRGGLAVVRRATQAPARSGNGNGRLIVRHTTYDTSRSTQELSPAPNALQQQLEFCCMLCGYDAPCQTCPIDWSEFQASKMRFTSVFHGEKAANVRKARTLLGMTGGDVIGSKHALKAAFRKQALLWHPDCNDSEQAEQRFKDIVDAYQFLLAFAL